MTIHRIVFVVTVTVRGRNSFSWKDSKCPPKRQESKIRHGVNLLVRVKMVCLRQQGDGALFIKWFPSLMMHFSLQEWAVTWSGEIRMKTRFPLECVQVNTTCRLHLYITHIVRADGIFLQGSLSFFLDVITLTPSIPCSSIAHRLSSFCLLPCCLYQHDSLWYHLRHTGVWWDISFYHADLWILPNATWASIIVQLFCI